YFKEVGWSPAGMAYWALLALGLASFGLNSPQMRLGRLLPWAALAGLGVFQVKVVPFFAVVAVPVLALNLRDALLRLETRRQSIAWQRGATFGRAAVALVVVALLVSVWPGWLLPGQTQASEEFGTSVRPTYQPRRWAVETP